MRLLTRARLLRRVPREKRAAEFDRAVAEFFMRLALEEAERGLGRTHPNPAVGAVLVKGGRVIARGHHRRAGAPHAEVVAIEAAGPRARGADLYSTLEPCDHFGRTPPCTQAILEAGVRRVVYASADPNPLVDGRGVARLRRAGVEVLGGVLREEADALNLPFLKFMRTGLPFVTLKAAATLDGKIASVSGDARWVTGKEARSYVHRLRDQVDAVLVGAGTVERDDPRLTARLPDGGRNPSRVVVDSHLRTSPSRRVYAQRSGKTIVATVERPEHPRARRLTAAGAEVWTVRARRGRVDLEELLRALACFGALHVLVEGGAEVFSSFLRDGLADRLLLFIAPKLLGAGGLCWSGELGIRKMSEALELPPPEVEVHGRDLLLRFELAKA
ncbi:MAG: bifunctional diaminohydroxyphosphoribosylaminopyrimidine deaminase/5-amino-6-(5-phosphoribosylamino)uracil reductase RibD [Myxococcales bacterium]|nr:bifunctional diaminohydroxyphosphoribosylaminopyrimidine deaminase/5-amino-6-(5-phosphoribosylamino)uracil reductase RibD [Myxococcales bacterium]